MTHSELASLWVSYNSVSGKASQKRIDAVMKQLDVETLTRMLTERNVITLEGRS
jgi:hypothetical protein